MTAHESDYGSDPKANAKEHVLVVDDEAFVRTAFQLYLETHGFEVSVAEDGPRAVQVVTEKKGSIDVALLDLVMPGMYGIDVLNEIKEIDPEVEVIIATGCGTVHSAVEAMRYGAFDYITKPIVDFERDLLLVVRAAVQSRRDKRLSEDAADDATTNPLARADYLNALEDLAALRHQPEEFVGSVIQVLRRYLEADAAVVLSRSPQGAVECQMAWDETSLDPAADADAARIAYARLWDDVESLTDEWTTLRRRSGSLQLVLPGGGEDGLSHFQARVVPLSPAGGDTQESHLLVLLRDRGKDAASASASAPTALLASLLEQVLHCRCAAEHQEVP